MTRSIHISNDFLIHDSQQHSSLVRGEGPRMRSILRARPSVLLQRRHFIADRVRDPKKALLKNSLPRWSRDVYFQNEDFSTFNDKELRKAHERLLEPEADSKLALRVCKVKEVSELRDFSVYRKLVLASADRLDRRIYMLAGSFFATGLSIGVVIPMLPILVKNMSLSPSEFSIVVSSFAVAKLVAGIPAGSYADSHGRKRVIVFGTIVVGSGIGLIGFTLSPAIASFSLLWLIGARLLTGVGHAFFTSGGLNYISDVSNSRNRSRSLAPISSSIHAGLMIGPVLGGFLVEAWGIQATYFAMGLGVIGIGFVNRLVLTETFIPDEHSLKRQNQNPFTLAFHSWKHLYRNYHSLNDVLGLNLAYWITLAGGQFCLLPLFMVQLGLIPSQIGISFAVMSVVTVVLGPGFASLADRYGKGQLLILGSGLLSVSLIALSHATDFYSLLGALVPLSMGSTILSSVPLALLSDIVKAKERPQAISLLRFVGDVGFLIGVSFAGVMSQITSLELTLQFNTTFIMAGICIFLLRTQKRLIK